MFSAQDEESRCLRHGYNQFCRTQSFAWCERVDCPDATRFRESETLGAPVMSASDTPNDAQEEGAPETFGPAPVFHPLDGNTSYSPRCVVDLCMLKLVSSVLSHIFAIRRVMEEEGDDHGLAEISCEHFLGTGWQAVFLKKFCVQLDHGDAGNVEQDLIALSDGHTNLMARPNPRFKQSHASNVVLIADNRDLDLTTVLPVTTEFRLSDVSHTM